MTNYVAIKNNVVINILEASTKEIAEEASGAKCIEYDNSVHPYIGLIWNGTTFEQPTIEVTND